MYEDDEDVDFGAAMAGPAQQVRTAIVGNGEPMMLAEIADSAGLDTRPVALSLVPYEEMVKILIQQAQDLVIDDEEGRQAGTKLANLAKKARLKVENSVKKSPNFLAADSYIKAMRNLGNAIVNPLHDRVEGVCRTKLAAYEEKMRLEQKRKEAAAREETRLRQAALDAEAEKQRQEAASKAKEAADKLAQSENAGWGDPSFVSDSERAILEETVETETEAAKNIVSPVAVTHVEEPAKVCRTEAGSSSPVVKWIPELEDITQVDRKLLEEALLADDKQLIKLMQKRVDGGLRNEPGFVIREKTDVRLRG